MFPDSSSCWHSGSCFFCHIVRHSQSSNYPRHPIRHLLWISGIGKRAQYAFSISSTDSNLRTSFATGNDRPTRFDVTSLGGSRVTLFLDWHLTKFEPRETNFLILRTLDRLVQTTARMTRGDEPISDGRITFRSPSLRLTAEDSVHRRGFTYSSLSTAVRGLGELLYDWGANGVNVDVYVGARKIGEMDLDFLL